MQPVMLNDDLVRKRSVLTKMANAIISKAITLLTRSRTDVYVVNDVILQPRNGNADLQNA